MKISKKYKRRLRKQKRNILGELIGDGISIFTACKDREDNLFLSLESWVQCSDIEEIIVVDWNSKKKLRYDHPRVKIARVDDEKWSQTKSFNLSSRLCSKKNICKLDADYILEKDFFNFHPLDKNKFYCGNWELARTENEKHLNGFLYVDRKSFMKVNGYNERLIKYGFDDTDIMNRLLSLKMEILDINLDKIKHTQHSNKSRTKPYGQKESVEKSIEHNEKFCEEEPWRRDDKMCEFHIEKDKDNYYVCKRIS
tara:strand:- start:2562 stop:3323 length:762 start_codon:yes stop_codon:yes gene_type:complete